MVGNQAARPFIYFVFCILQRRGTVWPKQCESRDTAKYVLFPFLIILLLTYMFI
jgi:hypothetical protein